MTNYFRWITIFLLGICLNACTAINLARVQNDLDKAIEMREDARIAMKKREPSISALTSLKNLTPIFKSIGEKAYKGSKKADDSGTEISFLRVAAVAAWQGGTSLEEDFIIYRGDGNEACDKLREKAPTRDCVLLLVLDPLFYSNNSVSILEPINMKISKQKTLNEKDWKQLKSLVLKSNYRVNTTALVKARCEANEFNKYGPLHPSVRDYLEKQFEFFKINAQSLKNVVVNGIKLESPSNKLVYKNIEDLAIANYKSVMSDSISENCFN